MQLPKDRTRPDAVEAVSSLEWTAIRAALANLLGADEADEYGLRDRSDPGTSRHQRNRTLLRASALLGRRPHSTPAPDD